MPADPELGQRGRDRRRPHPHRPGQRGGPQRVEHTHRPGHRDRGDRLDAITGSVPARLVGVTGCVFAPRCPIAIERCLTEDPELVEVPGAADGDAGAVAHTSACIRTGELR